MKYFLILTLLLSTSLSAAAGDAIIESTNVRLRFSPEKAAVRSIGVKPEASSSFRKMCDEAVPEIVAQFDNGKNPAKITAGKLLHARIDKDSGVSEFVYEIRERPDWRLLYRFTAGKNMVRWLMELENPDGELVNTDFDVRFSNLYVDYRKEFNTWALNPNGYTKLNYRADYIGEFPMTSILDEKAGLGLTINSSFSVMRPLFSIAYDKKTPERSVVFRNRYIGAGEGIKARVSLDFFGHVDDWRPGMGLIFDNYPGYFSTDNAAIRKNEGNFLCSWYFGGFTDEQLDSLVKLRMITNCELMFYNPYYGLYAPDVEDDEPWTILMLEKEKLEDFRNVKARQTTYNDINRLVERMREHKVGSFIYFNYIDGSRNMPDLPKRFGDQIFINAENRMRRGKVGGESLGNDNMYVMQMEPATPWGRHMDEQAEKLLKRIPDCDGYFIDMVNGYGVYDRNHSDGVTVINGKKAYYDAIGIARMQKHLAEKIWYPNGKGTWANGPKFPEISHYCDALIAEIPGWTIPEKDPGVPLVSFLCLDKPFVYMLAAWRKDNDPPQAKDIERHFKYGLLHGGFVDAFVPMQGDLKMQAFKAYLPLFAAMRGRKWVFDPHPLQMEKPLYGNIFTYADGSYTVYIFDRENSVLNPPAKVYDSSKISVKVSGAKNISKAVFTSVTDPQNPVEVPLSFRKGRLSVNLKNFSVAGMLRLIP